MERIARAVPVKSKHALLKLAEDISAWPISEKEAFFNHFGPGVERWYYQEIEGKPYLIAVAEGETLSEGFNKYQDLDDPYFNWFRDQVKQISGIDLTKNPTAADSEFILELSV